MIIELFKLIAVVSIWVLGYTAASQEGMILYPIRLWAEKKYNEGYKIMEAVAICHWCMPSVHSIFGYSIALLSGIVVLDWRLLVIWPLVVFGSSMLNGLVWATYQLISSKTEYYKNINERNDEYEENNYEQDIEEYFVNERSSN